MSASENLQKVPQVSETFLFGGLFSTALNSQLFAFIMKFYGHQIFITSLVLSTVKFAISLYNYYQDVNKNINAHDSLFWDALQFGLIGTAIIGGLAVGGVFLVLTPVLFVTAMALDTLRNVALLLWNAGCLAVMKFQLRQQLADPVAHPLTKIKYDLLKKQYIEGIGYSALGAFIGLLATAAVTLIFLFPHVGLGAIAGAGFTVTVGAVALHFTAAGIVGAAAGFAMIAPIAVPVIYKGLRFLGDIVKDDLVQKTKEKISVWKSSNDGYTALTSTAKPVGGSTLQIADRLQSAPSTAANGLAITTMEDYENIENHALAFNALTKRSACREVIIDYIDKDEPEVAQAVLQRMISHKIGELTDQIAAGKSWFENQQTDKRQGKITALQKITTYLNDKNKDNAVIQTVDELLSYIDKEFPAVKKSFFLAKSDTQDILDAVKAYGERFEKPQCLVAAQSKLYHADVPSSIGLVN